VQDPFGELGSHEPRSLVLYVSLLASPTGGATKCHDEAGQKVKVNTQPNYRFGCYCCHLVELQYYVPVALVYFV